MKVTIDGQSIEVEPGTTILQAARMIGGEVVPPNAIILNSRWKMLLFSEVAKEVKLTKTNAQINGILCNRLLDEWK
jgi:hypothetical protein